MAVKSTSVPALLMCGGDCLREGTGSVSADIFKKFLTRVKLLLDNEPTICFNEFNPKRKEVKNGES